MAFLAKAERNLLLEERVMAVHSLGEKVLVGQNEGFEFSVHDLRRLRTLLAETTSSDAGPGRADDALAPDYRCFTSGVVGVLRALA